MVRIASILQTQTNPLGHLIKISAASHAQHGMLGKKSLKVTHRG